MIVLVIVFLLALAGWWHSDTGALRWDGQGWLWSGFGDVPVQQSVLLLDFQQLLLVKLVSVDGAVAWLWLRGGRADRQWLALRRAIVAANLRSPPPKEDSLAPEGERL